MGLSGRTAGYGASDSYLLRTVLLRTQRICALQLGGINEMLYTRPQFTLARINIQVQGHELETDGRGTMAGYKRMSA